MPRGISSIWRLPTIYLVVVAAACSQIQQLGTTVAMRPSLTDADEARMAQHNAAAFEDSVAMWDDPLLEGYVTEIVQRIVPVAKPRPFPYRVRVVKDPALNAFTFGGGFIYVYAGLLARMENEAQLAMVLGHEIAHVTERHVPNGIEKAFGIEVLAQLAASVGEATGALQGPALQQAYEYGLSAAINGHGRGQESEADQVGLDYMVKAGFDPREAPGTFALLYKEYGDPPPLQQFFYGSHPTNVSRYDRLTQMVGVKYGPQVAATRRVVNTEEFKRRTREVVVTTGVLDYERKMFKTARAMFEKALPVSEGDATPHYYLGKIALETGGASGVDSSIVHLMAAIKEDPTFGVAFRELGVAYYRKRDKNKGITALEQYLKLEPEARDRTRVRTMITELRRY